MVWEKFAASKRGRNAEPPSATRLGWEQLWCWMRGRDPTGAPGHLQAGSAGSGWKPWDCPNSSELALIFITVFAWAFLFFVFLGFFFSVKKNPLML